MPVGSFLGLQPRVQNGREILSYADFIGNIGRVDVLLRPVVLLTPYVYIAAVLSLVRRCRGYDIASDADAALIRGNLYRYLAALALLLSVYIVYCFRSFTLVDCRILFFCRRHFCSRDFKSISLS